MTLSSFYVNFYIPFKILNHKIITAVCFILISLPNSGGGTYLYNTVGIPHLSSETIVAFVGHPDNRDVHSIGISTIGLYTIGISTNNRDVHNKDINNRDINNIDVNNRDIYGGENNFFK